MKWFAFAAIGAASLLPGAARAQVVLPIGHIVTVEDRAATTWGMSGMEMIHVRATIKGQTPITRTLTWDARTVEILSRTQAPPLRTRDVKRISHNGREFLVVRRYLLLEVMPEDARAEGMTRAQLANKWAMAVRRVLPQVAPMPSRFGI